MMIEIVVAPPDLTPHWLRTIVGLTDDGLNALEAGVVRQIGATAATPPMKSESGFLNTRHDTKSADTKAASPAGRKKSAEDWSPRSNSARATASKPLRNGQGRTIGAVTVAKLLVCLA